MTNDSQKEPVCGKFKAHRWGGDGWNRICKRCGLVVPPKIVRVK